MPGNSARSPEGAPLPRAATLRLDRRLGAARVLRDVRLRLILIPLGLALAAACAPTIETPAEAGLRRDLRDAERIAAQLRQLPMVQAASVTLTRAVVDPLRPSSAAVPSATASVVLVLAPRGDAQALAADARAVVAAVAPEVPAAATAVLARPSAPPAELARLGPFEVATASRTPLLAALLGLLALCAALGSALALRERARRATPAAES